MEKKYVAPAKIRKKKAGEEDEDDAKRETEVRSRYMEWWHRG